MKKKIILCLLQFTFVISLFAQAPSYDLVNYVPPSPQAANYIRYGEIPVSHSTGVPHIEIPIYTLQAGNYQFPISISYHAGGIKVRDIASTVGLGWVLNAGGIISRSIVGAPDNLTNNLSAKERFILSTEADVKDAMDKEKYNYDTWQQILAELVESKDTQSDRYFYSINGLSGIFRFDSQTGELKTIPYNPIKIEIGNTMSITDTKGIKYTFAQTEKSKPAGSAKSGITSWYLTTVKFPGISDNINITYKGGEQYFDVFYTQTMDWPVTVGDNGMGGCSQKVIGDFYQTTSNSVWSECVLIEKITWRNTTISFNYENDRKDVRKERLSKIIINNGSSVIKEIEFNNNNYFGGDKYTYRMKLNSVSFKDNSKVNSQEKYTFGYNEEVALPPYYNNENSNKCYEDYWGYYNGTLSKYMFPRQLISRHLNSASGAVRYTTDRNSSGKHMQAAVLNKIIYPTGGKTIFEYESNRATNAYTYDETETEVGGLRVTKISNYKDNTSLPEVKSYVYESASATSMIEFDNFFYTGPHYVMMDGHTIGGIPGGIGIPSVVCIDKEYKTLTTNSVCPLIGWGSSPVFYKKITEYKGDKSANSGWTVYNYYPSDQDYSSCTSKDIWPYTYFSPASDCDRGQIVPLLESQYTYDNKGNPVQSVANSYYLKPYSPFFTGVRVSYKARCEMNYDAYRSYNDPYNKYSYLHYFYKDLVYFNCWAYPSVYLLTSTTTIDYYDGKEVKQRISYEYDDKLRIMDPTSITITNSNNDVIKTENIYTYNGSGSVYTDMISNNILSDIIEVNKYKNNVLQGGTIYNYGAFSSDGNTFYRPTTVLQKNNSKNTRTRIQYLKYDKKGNPQYIVKDGVTGVIYLWSYNYQYPVAKIEGLTYTELTYKYYSQTLIDALAQTVVPDKSQIDNIRNKIKDLPNVLITTYTYKPLVGKLTETDPSGKTIHYEYDLLGRLQETYLKNGSYKEILESYEYNYSNQ